MKRVLTTTIAIVLAVSLYAQSPDFFNYQGIARDLTGAPLLNRNIGLRITILQSTTSGTEVYKELHLLSTSTTGLFNLQIGNGTPVIGSIATIKWGNGPYYLKVEMDENGGSNYKLIGNNQLLSVPYALYAKSSGDSTVWGKDGTNVFYTSGNVGIGTTNPTSQLVVDGVVDVNNHNIRNVADPVNNKDAVNKAYVDALMDKILQLQADLGVKDVDGNSYKAVKIGNQVWMAENLRTTKYNDGTPIPFVADGSVWANLTSGAYCYYNLDQANEQIYGKLYNWFTVIDNHKLCPTGWHVPTINEFYELINFLGGNDVAGGKLKATGTERWSAPNTGATNESGFTALPGGNRNYFGNFDNSIRNSAAFWSTHGSGNFGSTLYLHFERENAITPGLGKLTGNPVRCIKD